MQEPSSVKIILQSFLVFLAFHVNNIGKHFGISCVVIEHFFLIKIGVVFNKQNISKDVLVYQRKFQKQESTEESSVLFTFSTWFQRSRTDTSQAFEL